MHGSLALAQGVLWIARVERGTWLGAFDLDGQRVTPGFLVPPAGEAPPDVRGLAVDADRRLWIADRAAGRLRAFTVFGSEVGQSAGAFEQLAGLAADGVEGEARLLASSGGERRHALFLCDREGGRLLSLRPEGDPQGEFRGLAGVALRGREAWACEGAAGRIQVFRDGQFHHSWRAPARVPFHPRAVAPLADGRLLVLHAGEQGALLLGQAGGRLSAVLAEGEELVDPQALGGIL